MVGRAILIDDMGTLLDWSAPWAVVDENALRRAHAEADSVVRVGPFPEFHDAWRALAREEHAAKDPGREAMDYPQRFRDALDAVGAGKRAVRVLGARMHDRYFRELSSQVRLAPDALDALRDLPDDVKIALVTNHGHGASLREALDRLDVYYRFDAVVVSGDVGVRKPHPRILQAALDELDVPAEDALMVGDEVADVTGAHAVGIRAALVANPRDGLRDPASREVPAHVDGAVAVLQSLRDLPELVRKLG